MDPRFNLYTVMNDRRDTTVMSLHVYLYQFISESSNSDGLVGWAGHQPKASVFDDRGIRLTGQPCYTLHF